MRWIRIGTAIAPRARKNTGVRKDIWLRLRVPGFRLQASDSGLQAPGLSSHSHQPLAARQVAEQRMIERLRRIEERVIDPMLGELRRERVRVIGDQLAILVAERLGNDGQLLPALEILETRRIVVPEVDLGGIEHVEDEELVSEEAERLDRLEDDV